MTESPPTDGDAPSMAPEELLERLRTGESVSVLDVRNRDEFEEWRIDGPGVSAAQIPHAKFLQAQVMGTVGELASDLDEPILVVCGRGQASAQVASLLNEANVNAANLDGGMEAWARLYVPVELARPEATVLQYQRPSSGCLAYLVVSGEEAAVIDPLRAFADRYVEDARSLGAELKYAIDTHVHADHVSGVRDVAGASDAEPVLPAGAIERGLEFDATTVEDGDELRVGDATLRAIHAPGHTGEMTAFLLGNLLFDGDLLFLDGVARPDLEVGDEGASDLARQLYRTLHAKVLPLSDDTGIAPGHYGDRAEEATGGGYVAPLGDLEGLRALSLSEDEFVEFVAANAPPQPANYEEIVEINLGRRGADDAEAFELELGPNNCAASASSD